VTYLSLPDAARRCGYSPGHFRRLLRKHPLPAWGPGGNRYAVEDLDKWMREPGRFKVQRARRGFTRVEG
jgi:hypothetical protein